MGRLISNVKRAALLDANFYSEVARDAGVMKQAALVVVLANLLGGVGAAIATESNVVVGAAAGVVTGVVGWFVWSGVAYLIGVRVLGGDANYSEIRRVIGFAYAPLAIGVVPWLGFIGAAWTVFAAVVAIRESMEFSTRRSIATTGLGWAVWLGLSVLLNVIVGWDFLTAWPM